ncbi:MAG: hypothetical protein JO247_07460 [Chloroflexi bacterium]|nr:hypothetical protein [Chloroflexota bacterium]
MTVASANGKLVLSSDRMTVYDSVSDVTWLADANLAASNRFGLPVGNAAGQVPSSGAMGYQAAMSWIGAMNAVHYLGHANWQIPTTPPKDKACGRTGPHGESFGFGCKASALAALYGSLGLTAPASAVAPASGQTGPFKNLQPDLYWSQSQGGGPTDACGSSPDGCGMGSFSFSTGFHGANTKPNFLFVLPSIKGRLPGTPAAAGNRLQASADGQAVYDPLADRTWLANANLAAANTFGLARCTDPLTPPVCVAQNGAMTFDAATQFIGGMNAGSYLGQKAWELPPLDNGCPNFGCKGDRNPMGSLFYDQLGKEAGATAVEATDAPAGPFRHLQPYLYWTCQAESAQAACEKDGPVQNQEWSFSFGSGFQGTDILENDLYVMPYFAGKG